MSTLLSEFEGFYKHCEGFMDKWRFSGTWGDFGKGELFMYGGVIPKMSQLFRDRGIALVSLGPSIKIDEFRKIPVELTMIVRFLRA
jgi:hypothetical protein